MYTMKGKRIRIFEVEADVSKEDPHDVVKEVYLNGSEHPLSPQERREFIEENRQNFEYLCSVGHQEWVEEHVIPRSTTVH